MSSAERVPRIPRTERTQVLLCAHELAHRADKGMYAAKAAGGGRVSAGPVVA